MAADIVICTFIEDIMAATSQDADLQLLRRYIIRGWPFTKDEVKPTIQRYWPIRHDLAMIDGAAIKVKQIIISYILQK